MKINKRNLGHWLLLLRQGAYTLLAIFARYLSPRPRKPVVVLYGHQLSGNLKALYEEWQQSHSEVLDCYFLSLDPQYDETLRSKGVNVLRCGSLADMLLVGRSSAIITDHGVHAMSPLISLTSILFIDVWHGIPFKGFIPDDFRVQHRYEEAWVSSPLLKQLYQTKFGFSPNKVIDMGYARTDKLFRGDLPTSSFRCQAAVPDNHKLVLYAPTWQQTHQGHEQFPFGESQDSFLSALSELCTKNSATLVIRSHLNAHISEKRLNNVLYCSMTTYPDTEALLQETDVLLCDWSSIAFDYLALNRPAVFLDVKSPYRNGFSLGPEYRYGEVVQDMSALRKRLETILQNPVDYRSRFGPVHADITRQVYGEHTDGLSARRQLERLAGMITSRTQ